MITERLIKLVKDFEGCKLTAYKDIVGIWTIGYGATGEGIDKGVVWTQEHAEADLLSRLEKIQSRIKELVKRELNQNQLDALTSFSYNLGVASLKLSMLLRCINMGHFEDAAHEFQKWCHAGGKVIPGLIRRREAERKLFVS